MGNRAAWAPWTLLTIWAVSTMTVATWWTIGLVGSDVGCEFAPGTSLYGESSPSLIPPGRTCTWEYAGDTHVDGPDPARLLVLGVALAGGAGLIADRLRGRRVAV